MTRGRSFRLHMHVGTGAILSSRRPATGLLYSANGEIWQSRTCSAPRQPPLTIHLNLDKLKKDPGFFDLLPHVQHNTSLLVFSFFTAEELAKALPDFPRSMPNLRSLKLGKSGQADWSLLVGPFYFSAHTLRVLSLDNIPLFPSILGLKTLTELSLRHRDFNLHLDTLLDFLEGNHSLESATLEVSFADASLRHSQRRAPIGNQLRHLSIYCDDAMDGRALISSIALQKGADLQIRYSNCYSDERVGLADILAGVPLTHLPSLSSPTFMECRPSPRIIRLLGPGGSFLYEGYFNRVVMVGQSDGFLPTAASIERLGKHVPVVEVMEGMELPKDLL